MDALQIFPSFLFIAALDLHSRVTTSVLAHVCLKLLVQFLGRHPLLALLFSTHSLFSTATSHVVAERRRRRTATRATGFLPAHYRLENLLDLLQSEVQSENRGEVKKSGRDDKRQ
jgi:hypothetical protein